MYVTHLHPRLLDLFRAIKLAVRRFYSLYIRPQLEKIRAKIFEYKTRRIEKLAERDLAAGVENTNQEEDVLDDLNGKIDCPSSLLAET
jgi:hypothetical protein